MLILLIGKRLVVFGFYFCQLNYKNLASNKKRLLLLDN